VTLNVAVNKFQPNMVKTAVLRLFGIPNNNNNNTNNNNNNNNNNNGLY